MKIDYNKCSEFIKYKLHIRLFPYQEIILKALCEEQEVRTSRGIGRNFVTDCIGKYIANLLDKNNYEKALDIIVPYTCAIKSGLLTKEQIESIKNTITEDMFKKDFLCK